MQLILSVPGAPILAFLTIDSRVIVASIEQSFGDVLRTASINGWEYLDKIVQVPFSLPDVAPKKGMQLVRSWLLGKAATPENVTTRLKSLNTKLTELDEKQLNHLLVGFRLRAAANDPLPDKHVGVSCHHHRLCSYM